MKIFSTKNSINSGAVEGVKQVVIYPGFQGDGEAPNPLAVGLNDRGAAVVAYRLKGIDRLVIGESWKPTDEILALIPEPVTVPQPVLVRDGEEIDTKGYTMHSDDVWLSYKDKNIHVHEIDGTLYADIWQADDGKGNGDDEPLATAEVKLSAAPAVESSAA